MRLRLGPEDGAVPLADLLRRLEVRGVTVERFSDGSDEPFGNGYVLSRATTMKVHFFDDPVPEAVIRSLADDFDIDRLALYFDKTERDLN